VSAFEVQIGQLRAAAKAAGSAADQARVVRPGTGLEVIATALPGGVAASKADALVSALDDRGKEWADEIDRWSTSVASVATTYAASDDAARRAFGK
jgi:hypothetical protein